MDSRPPSNDITLEIILIHAPSRIVTYAKEYENCPAWSTIEAILITFSFYYIIRLDVWIPSWRYFVTCYIMEVNKYVAD